MKASRNRHGKLPELGTRARVVHHASSQHVKGVRRALDQPILEVVVGGRVRSCDVEVAGETNEFRVAKRRVMVETDSSHGAPQTGRHAVKGAKARWSCSSGSAEVDCNQGSGVIGGSTDAGAALQGFRGILPEAPRDKWEGLCGLGVGASGTGCHGGLDDSARPAERERALGGNSSGSKRPTMASILRSLR